MSTAIRTKWPVPNSSFASTDMSIRQQKVAREIQRDLSVILNQFACRVMGNQLITLIDVEVTADLGLAKVYVGFMNSDDKEKSVETVNAYAKEIRRNFASGAGKHMRKVPEFRFYLDRTMDHAERIEKLLKNLK